jgi:uncharacterized protein YjiS (DUF1127 family)
MLHCSNRIAAMQNQPFNSEIETIICGSTDQTIPMEEVMSPIRTFRNWRLYNETVRELSRLNTRQLNDLGINRADIEKIARSSL